jgi:D-inositol-3-phosphate glycosyltransferase
MMDAKKIVIIGSAHPLRGGLATYNERLAREYISQGADVTIYTFTLQYPSILFPGKTQYSSEPAPEGLTIKRSINSINPMNWIRVGREIRKMRPDLVIVKFWIPFMAPCLGTICRIIRGNGVSRIVSIIDNIIPHEKKPGDRMLAKYWVNSVDGFVAMSRSVLVDLESFDKKKPVLYCPHPLYDNFGEAMPKSVAKELLGLDKDVNYILFFGFIREYKGLDLLLDAMAGKEISRMNVKLLVAGEFYCDDKPYFEQIQKSGIGDMVIMTNDFIPDSEVGIYFCAADIVVQPYKNATQSGVTQIAYHFNKPMIITDVGGLAEFVPDGKVGYVVKPEVAAIEEAIVRFYKEGMEGKFSTNAEEEKRKYSWEKMTDTVSLVMKNEI